MAVDELVGLTDLQKANKAFREGNYQEALSLYLGVARRGSVFKKMLEVNVKMCLNRLEHPNKDLSITELLSGLAPSVDTEEKSRNEKSVSKEDKQIINYADAFDADFYFKRYPDIKQAGVDPLEHYSSWGWREGRLPNSWFDPAFYIDKYEDARLLGVEPLSHYIEVGQFENRKTKSFSISSVPDAVKSLIPKISFDDVSENFVDYIENEPLKPSVKLLAFYLPQFHPFPENDAWWGKGFTEWTNVTKAQQNFKGHYQPHFPIHNGYYDLRVPEVMIEQARLAKNYGIHGFNFYYYWFDGKVLMHKPFEILLKHKEIDINFCITWANENWTRRWDGAEHDVLIGQNHCEEDSTKFIEHMFQYFNDKRYIRIDNKPVLIIYHSKIIPNMAETIELWRRKVKEAGFDGIYLIAAQTFGFKDPNVYGFDAAMEFPPHTVKSNKVNDQFELINGNYEGNIYSYDEVVRNSCLEPEPDYKRFRTAMLSWDNTARKQNNSHIFAGFSMLKYKQWLSHITNQSYNNSKYSDEEKFVFINAWNEWAEGTHLEPDRKRGYAYLQTTFDVLKDYKPEYKNALSSNCSERKNQNAVILHIHYTEVWSDIAKYLSNLDSFGFDLFVTITNTNNNIIENIRSTYPNADITLVENRGRDIRPFIGTYKKIKDLGYAAVCKVHSKKSMYREDGDKIRDEIFDGLLGSKEKVKGILELFNEKNNVGLVTLSKYLMPHTDKNMTYDREIVHALAELLDIDFEYSVFPAGSMFWFKPHALSGLEKIEEHYFEPEEGLADGTLAHAIERIIICLLSANNFNYIK